MNCYNDTDFQPVYVLTSTRVLSGDPSVVVPLLSINGWILLQRKVMGGLVSFRQNWAEYRDGFGSPDGNDVYWLGLDKVYRLQQLGNVRLRIEVKLQLFKTYLKAYIVYSSMVMPVSLLIASKDDTRQYTL